jgi:hypothetical protein
MVALRSSPGGKCFVHRWEYTRNSMEDPVAELEHPSWCDRTHCTATKPRPEYRAGETGFHRSAPVTVEHIPNVGNVIFDPDLNPLLAHLSQPAPPWDPETFINVGTVAEPDLLSLTTTRASIALQQLGALVASATADEPPARADP